MAPYQSYPGSAGGSANSSAPPQQNMRKLYIRNLDFKVISQDLKSAFSKFGEILKCDVPSDHANPNRCKG